MGSHSDDSSSGAEAFSRASAWALKALARREHSRQELFFKLIRKRFDDDVVDRVLDDFEQRGWLDNERFAEVYVGQRRQLNYGPVRIEAELQQRGIGFEPQCLSAVTDREWVDHALEARQRRFGLSVKPLEWDEWTRQARFLAQRGFTAEQVDRALSFTAEE